MSDLAPADWEIDNNISPEEQAKIDALHAALVAPSHIDALNIRIEALQAQLADAQTELARVEASVADLPADVVAEADAEAIPETSEAPVEAPVEAPAPEAPEAPAEPPVDPDAPETQGTGKSTDLNAADAVVQVATFTDADALKAWIEGDDRKTVLAAVEKKQAELSA